MKIMKILEFHLRITQVMNILDFLAKITKVIETNHRIRMKTYENLLNLKILCDNDGNH